MKIYLNDIKLYIVSTIDYGTRHENILGIYDSRELAQEVINNMDTDMFDDVIIKEYELNKEFK